MYSSPHPPGGSATRPLPALEQEQDGKAVLQTATFALG